MTRSAGWRFVGSELLLASVSALLALVVAVVALRVGVADLGLRWSTGGSDQVLHYEIFSSAQHTFPFFPNDHLGFPTAQNLFFAPLFDPWSALFVWASGLVLPNGIWALNLYNLGSFLAVGFTSYAFFRALKVRRVTALVFGVLFATVPFHFVQLAIGHPFLSNYWAVPLVGILVLMVAGDRTNPFAGWAGRSSSRRQRFWRRAVPVLVLVPAVAFTQSYYFVFGVLLVGGVWVVQVVVTLAGGSGSGSGSGVDGDDAASRDSDAGGHDVAGQGGMRAPGRWRQLVWPTVTAFSLLLLIGIQLAVLSLNLGDRYQKYFGARSFTESESYGGKMFDLLLPSIQSGILPLAHKAQDYNDATGLLKTSESASTAAIASLAIVLCFALLGVRLLWHRGAGADAAAGAGGSAAGSAGGGGRLVALVTDARVGVLLAAFLIAFLFFITSGLGTVLAFFVSPEIRAWSRISIVVSMFALGVLAVAVDRLTRRAWTTVGVLAVVCVVGFFDQVPRIAQTLPLMPVSDSALREFTLDVEDALPPDCGVVELPLKGFPETGPMGRMGDYDEALPYVYSGDGDGDLRWSYGGVSGTASGDYWKDASTMPAAFASATAAAGACAIVVDTYAYSDNPDGWKPFVEAVGLDPTAEELTSSDIDGRYLLFELQR